MNALNKVLLAIDVDCDKRLRADFFYREASFQQLRERIPSPTAPVEARPVSRRPDIQSAPDPIPATVAARMALLERALLEQWEILCDHTLTGEQNKAAFRSLDWRLRALGILRTPASMKK